MWIIDPLDGTHNYVCNLPIFCISIALQRAGEIVLGVIDLPYMKQRYVAIRGKGAFCGNQRLNVSQANNLSSSLLATGFAYQIGKDLSGQMDLLEGLIPNEQVLKEDRSIGG